MHRTSSRPARGIVAGLLALLAALVERARGTTDSQARNARYAKIATQLQDEAATVFLVHLQHIEAVSDMVRGYRIQPLAHYVLVPELALSE